MASGSGIASVARTRNLHSVLERTVAALFLQPIALSQLPAFQPVHQQHAIRRQQEMEAMAPESQNKCNSAGLLW